MTSALKHGRALLRVVGLSLLTAFFYLVWASGDLLLRGRARISESWRSLVLRRWARWTARLLGMKVRVQGLPPRAPFFLVSNHLGYMDIVALASQLGCVFVAKREIAGWPVVGFLSRSMGTIFVDRDKPQDVVRVNSLIGEALGKGKGIVLFAEGTSSAGTEVLPFRSSLLEPAAKADCPVSYASLSFGTPKGEMPAHYSVCWWGDMALLPHLYGVLKLSRFEAILCFGSEPIRARNRKTLARMLWEAVRQGFFCEARAEEPCRSITR